MPSALLRVRGATLWIRSLLPAYSSFECGARCACLSPAQITKVVSVAMMMTLQISTAVQTLGRSGGGAARTGTSSQNSRENFTVAGRWRRLELCGSGKNAP